MRKVLKLKHWQIAIPLFLVYIFYTVFSLDILNMGLLTQQVIRSIFGILGVVYIFGWILFIGLALNRIKENPYRINKILLVLFSFFCILGYSQLHLESITNLDIKIPEILFFFSPLLTFIGIIYSLRNVSKSIKSIEIKKEAKFNDYLIDAILLFAMPIGLWIIQPRLNKLYQQIE